MCVFVCVKSYLGHLLSVAVLIELVIDLLGLLACIIRGRTVFYNYSLLYNYCLLPVYLILPVLSFLCSFQILCFCFLQCTFYRLELSLLIDSFYLSF